MDTNKQRYSHYQMSDKVDNGGLMNSEQCKSLARKVMELYDSDGDGFIDSFQIGQMLSDCYRGMNKGFNPTPTDVASYARVLDKNGSGRIHLEDIEKLTAKYFGSQGGQGGGPGGIDTQNRQKQAYVSPLTQPFNSSSKFQSENFEPSSKFQPEYNNLNKSSNLLGVQLQQSTQEL